MKFVEKEELKKRFLNKDWDFVLDVCSRISSYILETTYKDNNLDIETRQDIVQECTMNFWIKIQQEKVDPENSIFNLIYKNSNFRILDFLRKDRNRKKKVTFCSYDGYMENILDEDYSDEELEEIV